MKAIRRREEAKGESKINGQRSSEGLSDEMEACQTLGEKGQLTGGYMLIILWFFKQFVHTFPRGNMLITF